MAAWPAGVGRIVLPITDSTMAEAARLGPTLAAPTWICALDQTAARGRRGRPWVNPKGNFSASLILRPDGPPGQVALRSFVAALALRDALAAITGRPDALALKWPNDVLLNGGKLAGILLESAGQGGRVDTLVIGIGVNLAAAPDITELEAGAVAPVSLVSETGVSITPEEFLDHLAPAYDDRERQFVTHGFAATRRAWLQGAARLGQTLTARTTRDTTTGTFTDVDMEGHLVLQTANGPARIAAADIFF
jgi:BirA family biotin operon repressor/biotin-[acetyl-CoA-carboxylase] ligase